mgnify:CR=1 FL=1
MTPSWNPKLEEQAIARCHRLGQKKEVYVFKFVMEEFSSISFESPKDPVYVVDKRKRKKKKLNSSPQSEHQAANINITDTENRTDGEQEQSIGHKRKRVQDTVTDTDFHREDELVNSSDEDEDIDDDDWNLFGGDDNNTNTEADKIDNNLIKLKFNSQWTGTCKNIEMYSEEMQDRKNQLEIDIGIRTQ